MISTVQDEVERIAGAWRGAPPIEVVAHHSELPVRVFPDAMGLYHAGKTWLVAANLPGRQAGSILAHEVLAHHGLRRALGAGHGSFLAAVNAGVRAGDGRLLALRDHVQTAYRDARGENYLPAAQLADEVVAQAAEWVFDAKAGRLAIDRPTARRLAALRGHVAREVLLLDQPADADQVLGALLEAEHQVRHGGPVWGLGARMRQWYRGAMKPTGPRIPATSLRESEEMLAAERFRETAKEDRQVLGRMASVVFLAAVVVCGAIFASMDVINWLSR